MIRADFPFLPALRLPMSSSLRTAALAGALTAALSTGAAARPVAPSTPVRTAPTTETPPPTVETFCPALVRRIPGLSTVQCQTAALTDTGARSVRGAPIMARDVPAAAAAPASGASAPMAEPTAASGPAVETGGESAASRDIPPTPRRVLVLGAIHGDELTATTLAMAWLRAAEKAGPEDLSRRIHWRFVPALNPDGVLGLKPSRTNARGVDLNRNFPTPEWEVRAPKWWQESTRRDPRRFPGHKALSEPESQWVHEEMARWDPDLIVSIHAPFGVLDFDGPVEPPKRIGRLWLDPVGVYPGSLGNYGGLQKGVPVLTIELAHALKPPTEPEMQGMWRDMMGWIEQRWRQRVAASAPLAPTPPH